MISTAPEDYNETREALVFISDELSRRTMCQSIPVIFDARVEDKETFGVSLESTESSIVIAGNATVVIFDDSGKLESKNLDYHFIIFCNYTQLLSFF